MYRSHSLPPAIPLSDDRFVPSPIFVDLGVQESPFDVPFPFRFPFRPLRRPPVLDGQLLIEGFSNG